MADLHLLRAPQDVQPWLFHPEVGAQAQQAARTKIAERLAFVDRHLAESEFLLGQRFTAADAYLFTIVGWSDFVGIDLGAYPGLKAYMSRIAARPAVREAMAAEGMKAAA